MWGLAYVTALLLALPPVGASARRGVVTDWLDNNRVDRSHICEAVVVASTRLSGMSRPGVCAHPATPHASAPG